MAKKEKLATEVCLAWEVMTCLGLRTTYDRPDSPCHWFNDHYGPYPAYTPSEDESAPEKQTDQARSFPAQSKGMRYNVPEILSGCRKAPIMSIGINPNLTSYQYSTNGTTWCYPYFDDIAKYAAHFRYRTVNQDRFDLEFVKAHLEPGTQTLAKAAGEIVGISEKNNVLNLKVKYRDGKTDTIRLPADHVLLYDLHRPGNGGEAKNRFDKGDVIAGKLALPEDVATQVIREPVGYYQRFQKMVESFKSLGDEALQNSAVRLGEDAAMGDMVACASPGWDAYFPDAVLAGIVHECVEKRQHFRKQVLQSRPAVIVFSGDAALHMFQDAFPTEVTPPIKENQSLYERLQDCLETPYWLDFSDGDTSFRARMIFSPHFSYPDSFYAGCRLSNEDWTSFAEKYPDDAKTVQHAKGASYTGIFVALNPDQEPYVTNLSPVGKMFLSSRYIDPIMTIGQVLLQEYEQGRLKLDDTGKHLLRTDGPCEFCENALFQIGQGCRYDK